MEKIELTWVREKIKNNEYLFTLHADEERRNDLLEIRDVEKALINGCILENYPDDKRGPSCLVCGKVNSKNVHVVCGRNSNDWLVLITVYIPTKPKWISPVERSKK